MAGEDSTHDDLQRSDEKQFTKGWMIKGSGTVQDRLERMDEWWKKRKTSDNMEGIIAGER